MEIFFEERSSCSRVKLPSIIFLIATSCSLAWPGPTAFSFVWGQKLPCNNTKAGKSGLAMWDYTLCVTWDFLFHARLINLLARLINLQQVDYTRQLCIRSSHKSLTQLKSLKRHHRHGAMQQLTQCSRIIMICCHHPPKFFPPKCLDGWIRQSFRPPKFCAIR